MLATGSEQRGRVESLQREFRKQVEAQLEKSGIKPTPQRVDIGLLILRRPCHLSADQIISQLHAQGSSVSKATVYNTLNLFAQKGIVREVVLDPSRLVYDSTTHPHHHFYNEDTGELIDVDESAVSIGEHPKPPAGTRMQRVDVVIRVRNQDR